ncbi:hypothetical protein [Pedobacter sp.]|uniref:hypothetical protein n=1 Tax=Pedobacter sp. TaxID=1411316 RepID=UPI003BAB5CF6
MQVTIIAKWLYCSIFGATGQVCIGLSINELEQLNNSAIKQLNNPSVKQQHQVPDIS